MMLLRKHSANDPVRCEVKAKVVAVRGLMLIPLGAVSSAADEVSELLRHQNTTSPPAPGPVASRPACLGVVGNRVIKFTCSPPSSSSTIVVFITASDCDSLVGGSGATAIHPRIE